MIVESTNSQIDDKSYMPLVMVKNGVWTKLFSDGAVVPNNIKTLKLPEARYDYQLIVDAYSNGLQDPTQHRQFVYFVDRKQTELDLGMTLTVPCFISAELVTKEI